MYNYYPYHSQISHFHLIFRSKLINQIINFHILNIKVKLIKLDTSAEWQLELR